jgi:hypothetical protein
MASTSDKQRILKGIQGLSSEALEEIADYVDSVRQRLLGSEAVQNDGLEDALAQLSKEDEAHLLQEFEDYAMRFPRE